MTYQPVSLATRSNPGRFGQDGTARLVNCHAENTGDDAKAAWTIYPSSGLDLWTTVQAGGFTGGVKAMLATDQYLYVWAGRKLTAIDTVGNQTVIATSAGDGAVYAAKNRRVPTPEVCWVSDSVAKIATGLTVTTITDPDLPSPSAVSVLDGYFLFPTTFDRVFKSAEDNGSTISALDFGKAQKKPDNTIFALGGERDAIIFGAETLEFWTNSPDGTGSFPFVQSQVINIGAIGAKAIVQLDRAVAWRANDGTIRILDGYSGQRISDHFVERKLASVDPESIIGFGWNELDTGHAFLAWTSPTFTMVYNLRNGRWHERQSTGRASYRGQCSVVWQGKTLIGDSQDGRIYEVNSQVNTEGGERLDMTCILPTIHQSPSGFILDEVAIDAVTGVGTMGPAPQDIDPVIMMSTSQDGGITYGAERKLHLGEAGQRQRKLQSFRFGKFGPQGCTLKMTISASVPRAIMGVAIKARPLA